MYSLTGVDPLSDTYLIPPTRERRSWYFRKATPTALIGRPQPDKPGAVFGREIKRTLKTRSKTEARKARDFLAVKVHLWEEEARGVSDGRALAQRIEEAEARDDERAAFAALKETSKVFNAKLEAGDSQGASDFLHAALSIHTLKSALEEYLADMGGRRARRTQEEVRLNVERLAEYLGEDARLDLITLKQARGFLRDHLGRMETRGRRGLSPSSIAKAKGLLSGLWQWCEQTDRLEPGTNVWSQINSLKGFGRDTSGELKRGIFSAAEFQTLCSHAPRGTPLGDLLRIGLLTGNRLEELAGLRWEALEDKPLGFHVMSGKNDRAKRFVPLTGIAAEVIQERHERFCTNSVLVFPDNVTKRADGRVGGKLSAQFGRLVAKVFPDSRGRLTLHSLRHTFRTYAEYAGVSLNDICDIGGWAYPTGKSSVNHYYHAKGAIRLMKAAERVAGEMDSEGFTPVRADCE